MRVCETGCGCDHVWGDNSFGRPRRNDLLADRWIVKRCGKTGSRCTQEAQCSAYTRYTYAQRVVDVWCEITTLGTRVHTDTSFRMLWVFLFFLLILRVLPFLFFLEHYKTKVWTGTVNRSRPVWFIRQLSHIRFIRCMGSLIRRDCAHLRLGSNI